MRGRHERAKRSLAGLFYASRSRIVLCNRKESYVANHFEYHNRKGDDRDRKGERQPWVLNVKFWVFATIRSVISSICTLFDCLTSRVDSYYVY